MYSKKFFYCFGIFIYLFIYCNYILCIHNYICFVTMVYNNLSTHRIWEVGLSVSEKHYCGYYYSVFGLRFSFLISFLGLGGGGGGLTLKIDLINNIIAFYTFFMWIRF